MINKIYNLENYFKLFYKKIILNIPSPVVSKSNDTSIFHSMYQFFACLFSLQWRYFTNIIRAYVVIHINCCLIRFCLSYFTSFLVITLLLLFSLLLFLNFIVLFLSLASSLFLSYSFETFLVISPGDNIRDWHIWNESFFS